MKPGLFKNILLHVLCALISLDISAQVVNSGNLYVAGNMYVNYDFTNNSNYQNDGNVVFTKNITNQSSMTEGSGTTSFIGTSQQNLNGSQPAVFHNVIDSNAAGIKMNVNVTIGGSISPVSGSIYFNDHALTMGGRINIAYTNTKFFNVTNKSDLIVNGTAAFGSRLYFDPAANTIHNVTVAGTGNAVLGDSLNITPGIAFGTVTVNGTFDANKFLTIKSDAYGTARIANSAGTISHFVTVERYVPPRRAWRFMAVPIKNDTLTIRTAWQEGANNYDLNYAHNTNPHPGFGTKITGDNISSKGYDYNTTTNPSLRTWAQTSSTWSLTTPPTATTLINSNSAYCIFIRGSRAQDLALATYAPPDPTILRTTGNIYNNTYTQTYSSITNGSYLFIGNPYASSIDLASVMSSTSGINTNKFYVWDPGISGSYGFGGYVTYDHGLMVPVTANYPVPTTLIQSGQAFMVQSNATNASVIFHQADKVASESMVFGRSAPLQNPYMYINLLMPSADSLLLVDGTGVLFGKEFSDSIDADDAIKFTNFNENIAMLRFDKRMGIETRPYPNENDTLFLKLTSMKIQPYVLEIKPVNTPLSSNLKPTLVDKYLKTETALKPADTTLYSFTLNADTASYMRRFVIVYKKQLFIATPHPVNTKYSNSASQGVAAAKLSPSVNIYPNPVTGKTFILNVKGIEKGNYKITVFSNDGKPLQEQSIQHPGGAGSYSIDLHSGMAAGIYSVHLISDKGELIQKTSLIISRD